MNNKVGIRYEDRFNLERRVAIIPEHVESLIKEEKLEFFIEKSAKRIYSDDEFNNAGANIVDDVSDIPVIFGVKEMPLNFFRPRHTYVFFSHTIKGQSYNMPALKKMMEMKVNLIDYERVTDEKGRRLIFFGRFAGMAGMVNSLWALGLRMEEKGLDNPFTLINQSHSYTSLKEAKEAVARAGELIRTDGLANFDKPLVVGFTGYGNVSNGAQEILALLPVEECTPEEILALGKNGNWNRNVVYQVVFREEDLVKSKEAGREFVLQNYYDHPELYENDFEQYIDKLTVLMNCMYWDDKYPKLITNKYLKNNYSDEHALKVIGDITCDPNGSIECTLNCTEIETPNFVYDTDTGKTVQGHSGKGILIMAVDILPSELPEASSKGFSFALYPFVAAIVKADYSKAFNELDLPGPIKNAMILHNGELTPDYEYMKQYLQE